MKWTRRDGRWPVWKSGDYTITQVNAAQYVVMTAAGVHLTTEAKLAVAKQCVERHCAAESVAVLKLPKFTLFGTKSDPPHRQKVLASCTLPNEHGVNRRFEVVTNHPETRWWVRGIYPHPTSSMRATNTLTTSSPKKAELWIAAVKAGRVEIVGD